MDWDTSCKWLLAQTDGAGAAKRRPKAAVFPANCVRRHRVGRRGGGPGGLFFTGGDRHEEYPAFFRPFFDWAFCLCHGFLIANIAGLSIYLRVLYDTHEGETDFSPSRTVRVAVEGLVQRDGQYQLAPSVTKELQEHGAWAMLLDDRGKVVWSLDLPPEIPLSYTPKEIAGFTRYYLKDYPVFCWAHPDGLVVTGYPKGAYMRYTLDFAESDVRTLFQYLVLFVIGNSLVAILLYAFLCWWTVRPVRPILHGLSCLAHGEAVQLAERGSLREVAAGINAASGELQRRDAALRKKDEARANWIAGISHDIRTPLSVILGYAGELQDDPALPPQEQEQAAVICRQGIRLRDLVSDLNLVSRLEYDMQPLEYRLLRAAKLVRRTVTDFMNAMPENPCGIELEAIDESIQLKGDERLLLRALTNLLQNSVLHNPQGCAIRIAVRREDGFCLICVYDDGVGADPQKLENLLNAPYAPKRAHGLGLFLVRRITEAHGGQFIAHTAPGQGFSCEMKLPCEPFIKGSPSADPF